jgi:hypothetical protein
MLETVLLAAFCISGLGLAAWMVVAWGRTRPVRQRLLVESAEPLELASTTVRAAVVGIVGGIIAGVLIGGLGGRLVMRVLAVSSGDSAQGLVTEAEETVGEITLAGSVGFVVFNGIFFGTIGGIGYLLIRRWLPATPWLGGLIYGMALLGLAPLDALDPDNSDFAILTPTWLAVLLVSCLFPLFGMTAASAIERFDRTWPRIAACPRAILAYSPLLLALVVSPIAVGILLAVGLVILLNGRTGFVEFWQGRRAATAGRLAIGVLAGVAAVSAGSAVVEILGA